MPGTIDPHVHVREPGRPDRGTFVTETMAAAAGGVTLRLNSLALEFSPSLVATVGELNVFPGQVSIIPGKVSMFVDIRDICQRNIDRLIERLKDFAVTLKDVDVRFIPNIRREPIMTTAGINRIVASKCGEQGHSYQYITSGAGHDTKELLYAVPATVIFVPRHMGISHSPKEYTSEVCLRDGLNVLTATLLALDKMEKGCLYEDTDNQSQQQ